MSLSPWTWLDSHHIFNNPSSIQTKIVKELIVCVGPSSTFSDINYRIISFRVDVNIRLHAFNRHWTRRRIHQQEDSTVCLPLAKWLHMVALFDIGMEVLPNRCSMSVIYLRTEWKFTHIIIGENEIKTFGSVCWYDVT